MTQIRRFLSGPILTVLIIMLGVPSVGVAESDTVQPAALRVADMSSPRATIRSFLNDTNSMIDGWRRGSADPGVVHAFFRATETMDFSNTAHSHAWSTQTKRVLMLKEVLDRIALPPWDRIPDSDEVDRKGIDSWRIPGSQIRLERLKSGPRKGDFVFSAGTVERLDRLYRWSKHLPYQPGATEGAYESYMQTDETVEAEGGRIRRRLMPIDTTSPRSTLQEFQHSINRAYELVMEADSGMSATPPTMTRGEAREIEQTANGFLRRAAGALDLSTVPAAIRTDTAVEVVLQIKEILDRTPLPSLQSIPDLRMVSSLRESRSAVDAIRWRLPNTEIEIVEVLEGERQGEFLFSARTIGRVGGWYESVADLPYRREIPGLPAEFHSQELSPGFFEFYISTPGYLLPETTTFGALIDSLPDWSKTLYGEQTLWQWTALLISVLVLTVIVYALFRYIRRLASRLRAPWGIWLQIVAPLLAAVAVVATIDFINRDLNFTGDWLFGVVSIGGIIVLALQAMAVFLVCKAIAESVVLWKQTNKESIDKSMIRISGRVIGFFVATYLFVRGVRDLGADVIPLLAGLGVGGLAVALAAQKTLANFIGALILFANKPVREGDFCRFGDQFGVVERIGLHSTRIRTPERSVISIPNADFSEMQLDNIAERDQRRLKTLIQLRYETTPDQMRFVLVRIRELLLGHPMVTPDPARARFVGYGAYSKDVEVTAYVRCRGHDTFLAVQEDILLRIEDIVENAGTGFAFPSQTAYLARDAGLDDERGRRAETEVRSWRETGKLPFPDFQKEDRDNLEDIIDYPPKGSPGNPIDRGS